MDENHLKFRNYMINRLAKIFPIYFILTLITVIVYSLKGPPVPLYDKLLVFFSHITFLKGFFESLALTGIAQGWSLTVEECFYVLAPLSFFLVRKSKHFLYIIPLFLLFIGFRLVNHYKGVTTYGFMDGEEFMMNMTIFGRSSELFIGMALAIVIKKKLFEKAPKVLTFVGSSIILICIYYISTFRGNSISGTSLLEGRLINNFLLPAAGISVLYLGLLREKTWFSSFLSSRLIQVMGRSSYVFYLIHIGIFYDLIALVSTNIYLVFILMNLFAYLLYTTIEKPLNDYLRKKLIVNSHSTGNGKVLRKQTG